MREYLIFYKERGKENRTMKNVENWKYGYHKSQLQNPKFNLDINFEILSSELGLVIKLRSIEVKIRITPS